MAPGSPSSSPSSGSRSRLERASRLKTRNPTPFMQISDQGLYSLSIAHEFTAEDCVFDLGCGCGRIMAEILERYPCRGVAVEKNPSLLRAAAEKLRKYGERVRVVAQDLRRVDLGEATAVVMFFTSVALEDLKRYLALGLSMGCVLLNYAYPVPGWWTVRPPTDGVYKYVIGEHRTRPRVENVAHVESTAKRSCSEVPLALDTAEAARTWDPTLGWYPFRKRSVINYSARLLTSATPPSPGPRRTRDDVDAARSRVNIAPKPLAKSISTPILRDVSHVADEERAVHTLHRAIDCGDIGLLRSAIKTAEDAGIDDTLLESARKHLLQLEAFDLLMKARVSKDPEVLRMVISKAEGSDLPRSSVEQMQQILQRLESTQQEPLKEEASCVSLPSLQRQHSAPSFRLPGVELRQRVTH